MQLESASVLHIAPNKQEYGFFKTRIKNGTYDRVNIRPCEYSNIVADITKSELKSDTYDFIVCWHVLEHIIEDEKAISEMFRILKPGGAALISVPIYPTGNTQTWEAPIGSTPEDYLKYCGHDDHKRCCGYDYSLRFEKAGFDTNELKCSELAPSEVKNYGLSPQHVAWLFVKPLN
ncbi:MAG: class I SAM-dependent methyltransferase [Flavipsychrobacter sp.]